MTEFVYVLIPNGGEWEDLKIFLTLDDAKNALKVLNLEFIIEINCVSIWISRLY